MSSPSAWSQSIIPVEVPNASLTTFSSYILKNLDNETVYDVRVKAMNVFGMSTFSKVFNFYVKTSGDSQRLKCVRKSSCPDSDSSDVAPQSLLTDAKDVSSGSSTISLSIPVILVLMFLANS